MRLCFDYNWIGIYIFQDSRSGKEQCKALIESRDVQEGRKAKEWLSSLWSTSLHRTGHPDIYFVSYIA